MLINKIFFACYFGYQAVTIWDQVGPCVLPNTGNSTKNSDPSISSDFLLEGQTFLKRSLIIRERVHINNLSPNLLSIRTLPTQGALTLSTCPDIGIISLSSTYRSDNITICG